MDEFHRGISGAGQPTTDLLSFIFHQPVQAAQSSSISGTGGWLIAPPPHAKKNLSELSFSKPATAITCSEGVGELRVEELRVEELRVED